MLNQEHNACAPFVVEFPPDLHMMLSTGGAEIVEEHRAGAETKRSLLILSEDERSKRIQSRPRDDPVVALDSEYLRALREARETLFADAVLGSQFLFHADSSLWPDAAVISDAARIRAMTLDFDGDEFRGGRLREAAATHANEWQFPGQYELSSSLVQDGSLELMDAQLDNNGTVCEMRPATASSTRTPPLENRVYTVGMAPKLRSLDEILALKMPSATQIRIRDVLSETCASPPSTFALMTFEKLVALHRAALQPHSAPVSGRGCFVTPNSMMSLLPYLKVATLTRRIGEANKSGRQIRLRVGVFMTPILLSELVVIVRAQRNGDGPSGHHRVEHVTVDDVIRTVEERVATDEAVEMAGRQGEWRDLRASGDVVCLQVPVSSTNDDDAAQTAAAFVSSSIATSMEDNKRRHTAFTVRVHEDLFLVFLHMPNNAFCVVYGSKCTETFTADASALRKMQLDLTELEEKTMESNATTRGAAAGGGLSGGSSAQWSSSASMPVEERLQLLKKAAYDLLVAQSLSFKELANANELRMFRSGGAAELVDVESSLRSALKDIAVYEGRVYKIKH